MKVKTLGRIAGIEAPVGKIQPPIDVDGNSAYAVCLQRINDPRSDITLAASVDPGQDAPIGTNRASNVQNLVYDGLKSRHINHIMGRLTGARSLCRISLGAMTQRGREQYASCFKRHLSRDNPLGLGIRKVSYETGTTRTAFSPERTTRSVTLPRRRCLRPPWP